MRLRVTDLREAASSRNEAWRTDEGVKTTQSKSRRSKGRANDPADQRRIEQERNVVVWTKWLAVMTGGLAAATFLLAVLSGWQVYEMRKAGRDTQRAVEAANRSANAGEQSAASGQEAINLSRENFIADQRPYIWLSRKDNPFLDQDGHIAWNWHFTNYGKSPAVDGQNWAIISLKTDKGNHSSTPISAHLGPVLSNQDIFATAFSDIILSEDEFQKILLVPQGITISGEIVYVDMYKHQYETHFCLFTLGNGGIGYCRTGNDIK